MTKPSATPDFGNIAALNVKPDKTEEYFFDMVPGEPSIFFSPATDENPVFKAERMRLSIEEGERLARLPRGKKAEKLTPEELDRREEQARENDRVLLARCCAKAWGTAPRDVEGNQPEFNEANCYAFLKALPNFMLDPLRNWAANIYNFVDRPTASAEADQLGN